MNIFMFYTNNFEANAKELDDILLNKMILETTQLLSTFFRLKGVEDNRLYKECYQNHPCQKWLQESNGNVLWLLKQLKAYLQEYKLRKKVGHKNILYVLEQYSNILADEPITPWKGLFGKSGCRNYFDYIEWKKANQWKTIHKKTEY